MGPDTIALRPHVVTQRNNPRRERHGPVGPDGPPLVRTRAAKLSRLRPLETRVSAGAAGTRARRPHRPDGVGERRLPYHYGPVLPRVPPPARSSPPARTVVATYAKGRAMALLGPPPCPPHKGRFGDNTHPEEEASRQGTHNRGWRLFPVPLLAAVTRARPLPRQRLTTNGLGRGRVSMLERERRTIRS
jgi:hypothetical protein